MKEGQMGISDDIERGNLDLVVPSSPIQTIPSEVLRPYSFVPKRSSGRRNRENIIAFQARLFSVPKKGTSKRRVILDISLLKKSIACPKFKMTTIRQVRQVPPRGCWTASVDLKDAHWHVPVHRSFQKFLGFSI